jgi:hypothetical protein
LSASERELVAALHALDLPEGEVRTILGVVRDFKHALADVQVEDVPIAAGTGMVAWRQWLESPELRSYSQEQRAVHSVALGWSVLSEVVGVRGRNPEERRELIGSLSFALNPTATETELQEACSGYVARARDLAGDGELGRRFLREAALRSSIDYVSPDPQLAVELARDDLEAVLIGWTRHVVAFRSKHPFTILPDDVQTGPLNMHPSGDLTDGDDPDHPWRSPRTQVLESHWKDLPFDPEAWSFSSSELMRLEAAEDPRTPPYLLATLSHDSSKQVRRAVARNDRTPPDALALLATDVEESVRDMVAANPHTPGDALLDMAVTEDWLRVTLVLQNPAAPVAAFRHVAERDPELVASHPKAPAEVLRELILVEGPHVRLKVAMNEATPADILAELATDPELRRWVAENPTSQPELLRQLAADPNQEVRSAVGINPSSPMDVLVALAEDGHWKPCAAVSSNANAPADLRWKAHANAEARRRHA